MLPVKQSCLYSVEGIGNGDCFPACLASLLDIPLWMVPPFHQMFGRNNWKDRVNEWLIKFFKVELVKVYNEEKIELPQFYIASGPSKRGVYHSVIHSNGILVHDPHYSNDGIDSVAWIEYLRNYK